MTNRILYVEDDPFLRDWVDYELSTEGYQVALASDGESGLQNAHSSEQPDLIILDIGLPEMDGFQLCRALQQDTATANIPIIFLSARNAIDDRLRGFQLGGLDYLPKPFAMAELKARIQAGLRRQQLGQMQEREAAAAEMSEASTLQRNLMQRSLPTVPGIDLAANCRPARHVAGDWFDFQSVGGNALYLVEADVSGKGMPAALLMSETRLSLQHACQSGVAPAEALSTTNHQLYDDLTTAGKFITTFVGRYDTDLEQITYACAGHPAVLLSEKSDRARLIQPADPPIGIFKDYTFSEGAFGFSTDDLLVVCSDGITEAVDRLGEMYGLDRLLDAITRNRTLTAADLVGALLNEIDQFSAGMAQTDDQTVIVLKGC
jgi:sigma-B regulation protein RsbU (phosphoserine phosphatase)